MGHDIQDLVFEKISIYNIDIFNYTEKELLEGCNETGKTASSIIAVGIGS